MNFETLLMCIIAYFGLFTAIFFITTVLENVPKLKNPSLKRLPTVTVVVPAYNEEKTISKTIRSLLKLNYPKNKLDIIVVDDGSNDKTYDAAKRFKAKNLKVYKKKNGGKASALNFALKRCKTEFFGALDADSFVKPGSLKKMLGYFDEYENVMSVTPALKVWKPKKFFQKIQAVEYLLGIFLRKAFALLGGIHVTPGPFSIYRKEFFDKYGGYDEKNLTEDIEVALRIQHKNYEIENSIDAEVYTIAPSGFMPLFKQRLRWYVGFLNNVWRYKSLFNFRNNLGIFVLPIAFISVGLVILTMAYTLYRFFSMSFVFLSNLVAIDFDIFRMLNFRPDIFFFNFDGLTILMWSAVALGILIVISAKKFSKEKTKIKYLYVCYMLIYWLLFGLWWSVAFAYKLIKKKVKWGKKYG